MSGRVLVAGVGNIFMSDDAFGCEVAQRLARETLPPHVVVEDYGIRGTHLAYELLAGYELAILIDAVPHGEAPGTLYVIEPDLAAAAGAEPDAHGMDLSNVFAMVRALGGTMPQTRIVGCEPATIDEAIGLSEPVERAVGAALDLVRDLLARPAGAARDPQAIVS